METSFCEKYGPWALVTGASRGLGAEFARQCAERGLNVVLVATNADLLRSRADELERDYGIKTRTVALDLGREDILQHLAGCWLTTPGFPRYNPSCTTTSTSSWTSSMSMPVRG